MRVIGALALSGATVLAPALAGAQSLPGPSRGFGASREADPELPTIRLGALLPLSGAAAWFGKEMRQGLELALAELNPAPRPVQRLGGASVRAAEPEAAAERADEPRRPPPQFEMILETLDVSAPDVHDAVGGFRRLAAGAVVVVFTASLTPTLAVHPLAAASNVLLVHQGVRSARFPRQSRALVHTRPPLELHAEGLIAYAREQGLRRLAVVASGDDFGRAVRAALTAAWEWPGASLVHVESLTLDAPDVASRLRRLVRLRPDAVALGFHGAGLGDVAGHLRQAGYAGSVLALDHDRAALLAANGALDGAFLVADAFVPESGEVSERFARAYTSRYGTPPSRYAANAYEAVGIVAEGLRAAGVHTGAAVGGSRLREALRARRRFPSVYGGEVTLRDDGTMSRPLALFRVDGGELVFVRYLDSLEAAG